VSYIHTNNPVLRAALISNFLVAELLASRARKDYGLWLVAPWIKDFALSVPPASDLTMLIDSAEPRPRLFEVLRQIVFNGGRVTLVVRTEFESARVAQFIEPLRELVATTGVIVRHRRDLHAKLYAGQVGVLYGSSNLTASGIEFSAEFNRYVSDVRTVAQLQAEAQAIFEHARVLGG
jgi:hypothetical protein